MKKELYLDPYLAKRISKYDEWLQKGQISFSSRVIPVAESFKAKQWVLPTEQVMEVLRDADSIAVQNCECRSHYSRCERPLEVCFILNVVGDKYVAKGRARRIDISAAANILAQANESGLVHLALYMPDHEVFALCSCCPCCCHDLQIVKHLERKDLMIQSEYIAMTKFEDCTDCGTCVDRCFFEARTMPDEKMEFNGDACLGCGLCVSICPNGATSMQLREQER